MVRISIIDKNDIVKSFIKITVVIFVTTFILRYTKIESLNNKEQKANFTTGLKIR